MMTLAKFHQLLWFGRIIEVMRAVNRLRRFVGLVLEFIQVLMLVGTKKNQVFWPMQKSLSSHLRFLGSKGFVHRMLDLKELSENKDRANQERYLGNQSKRDSYNSKFALEQRNLQVSISESKNTSRLLGRNFSGSFGHSAYGIGDRIKAKQLGLDNNDYVLLGSNGMNSWLIENYWTKHLSFVTLDDWVIDCLEIQAGHLFEDIEYLTVDGGVLGSEVGAGIIELKWQERFPNDSILEIDSKDREYGYSSLLAVGLRDIEWFITFHFRRRENEVNRNVQAFSYLEAIEFALSLGAHVLVIGEETGIGERIRHPRFLDLASRNQRDSRLDLFLLGECEFMVGSSTGPIDVPPLFGKGVLWTNCNSLVMNRLHKDSIVIPRLRIRETFPSLETFITDIGNGLYENDSLPSGASGIQMIENTSDEILAGFKEMLSRDLNSPPVGLERKIIDAIKRRSGVESNRISLSFLNKYFGELS